MPRDEDDAPKRVRHWSEKAPASDREGWTYDRRNCVVQIAAAIAQGMAMMRARDPNPEPWENRSDEDLHKCADDAFKIALRIFENGDKAFPRPS